MLIIAGWFATALLSQNFGGGFRTISISRGTGDYHGVMAAILFVGYAILCLHNIRAEDPGQRINLPWILAIGMLVQFSWEFVLLITGIRARHRPAGGGSLLEIQPGASLYSTSSTERSTDGGGRILTRIQASS